MESNQTTERKTYHEQKYIDNTLRLREILKTLPAFAKDYFRAAEPTTSAKTRISYAYDIRVFFHFLMENNPVYKDYTIDLNLLWVLQWPFKDIIVAYLSICYNNFINKKERGVLFYGIKSDN